MSFESPRELELELENYRLRQRLDMVAKFAEATEKELILIAKVTAVLGEKQEDPAL